MVGSKLGEGILEKLMEELLECQGTEAPTTYQHLQTREVLYVEGQQDMVRKNRVR
jgi:hypothetical protein